MTNSASDTIERNKQFLELILRTLEYLGCQALDWRGRRGYRDGLGGDGLNKCNFQSVT